MTRRALVCFGLPACGQCRACDDARMMCGKMSDPEALRLYKQVWGQRAEPTEPLTNTDRQKLAELLAEQDRQDELDRHREG